MANNKNFDFPGEGVKGRIPNQKSGKKLKIQKGNKKDKDTGPGNSGFAKTRFVMDVVVVDEATDQPVTAAFDPKLELRVRYNQGDVNAAGGNVNQLALGFWDGEKWVRFTAAKHNFRLEPGNAGGGEGVVELESFGDPPVAWGK